MVCRPARAALASGEPASPSPPLREPPARQVRSCSPLTPTLLPRPTPPVAPSVVRRGGIFITARGLALPARDRSPEVHHEVVSTA